MARHRSSLFETVMTAPWWAGILVGLLGLTGAMLAPLMAIDNPMLAGIPEGLRPVGYLWFGIFCLASLVSALRARRIVRKFDGRAGLRTNFTRIVPGK